MEFTEESTLEEVLEAPGAEEILAKYNVPCLRCPMVQIEMSGLKLGEICANYRIDLKNLLLDLNLAGRKNARG